MNFGTRIRDRRKALGWSQAKLEEESGISQQMLSKLERGVAFGTTEAVALARALKVSPMWLETGEGPMEEAIVATIAPDEQILLKDYRDLPPERKPVALAAVNAMVPKPIPKKRKKADPNRSPQADDRRVA